MTTRVHLDYERVDKDFKTQGLDESKASKLIQNILQEIRKQVNERVAIFSRVHRIIEQNEVFIKTPTKK